MKNIISVENLSKYYKEVKAVDNISFNVKEGEFFAFLGVNGAGKSTTINMITGTLEMDEGKIVVNDNDVSCAPLEVKKSVGVVFQSSVLDQYLSAYENLYYRGKLYGLSDECLKEKILELANQLEFYDFLKRPLNKLSGGQNRKLDLARALIHEPKIVILDEPTTGLDPQTRKLIWKYLADLKNKKDLTIFLTTHYMEEATLADRVVIIDEGKILTVGTPSKLKEKYAKDYLKIYKENIDENKFKNFINKYEYKEENEFYLINIKNTKQAKEIILDNPTLFDDFEIYKGSMDDVFLNVTGKKIGDNNE